MKVASGIASGSYSAAALAEQAVGSALAAAGLGQAGMVLLFLTRDLAQQAPAALLAAARTAGSLQIFGSTASGLFTEHEVLLDQSGAAAMVIGHNRQEAPAPDTALLAFSGNSALPVDWQDSAPRVGLLDGDTRSWAHGRLLKQANADFRINARQVYQALSTGLRQLSAPLPVSDCATCELRQVDGQPAVTSLRRYLPPELRAVPLLHQLSILRQPDEPGIAILSANADGSLTLAEALNEGEDISWAIRQPLAAEQDMRQSLAAVADEIIAPDFALMFSCIGRGPLFYGGVDRDQQTFCEQFPGLPLLGLYGHGQIAATRGKNRLFHNSVVTLLIEGAHV